MELPQYRVVLNMNFPAGSHYSIYMRSTSQRRLRHLEIPSISLQTAHW